MSQVRIGIVGVGRFGRAHIEAYRRLERAEIVGVVDADRDSADLAAAEYGVPAFDSVAEMLGHGSPQGVSIVVPARLRGTLVDEIASSGAAVFIEKPLAADGRTATAAAARWRGRPVMVGHILRLAAPYRRMLGELDARHNQDRSPGRSSRIRDRDHLDLYPTEDVVGLTLIHDIDAVHWLSGSYAAEVRATGRRSTGGCWSDVDATLTTGGGASWHLHAAWSGEPEDQTFVAGLSLVISADRSVLTENGVELAAWARAGAIYDEALRAELDHFLDCVISDKPSEVLRLTDAAAAVRVVDAVRVSLEKGGEPVEVEHP